MEERNLGRITAFTDGVMAVAITLLVLNLHLPELATRSSAELGRALGDLADDGVAYAFSFALVGRYWVLHHRLFERLRSFDGTLMALNLAFLALIAFMPFSAELQTRYGDLAPADAVFGSTLALAALTHWLMALHAARAGLEREPEADRRTFPAMAMVFFASVPVAFLSTTAAQAIWISTIFVRYPLRRLGSSATSE